MAYSYSGNYYAKKKSNRNDRPDHRPGQRMEYERNRAKILKTERICGICGQHVDKSLKYPDPYCATIDHIIPVSKGGHPSDIENLQLAHFKCNRLKSDSLLNELAASDISAEKTYTGSNLHRGLPLLINWAEYDCKNYAVLRLEVLRIESTDCILTAQGIKKR